VGLNVRRNASALGHHPTSLDMGGAAGGAGPDVRLLDRPAAPTSHAPPWLSVARALPQSSSPAPLVPGAPTWRSASLMGEKHRVELVRRRACR
jgi:hypothetical protein